MCTPGSLVLARVLEKQREDSSSQRERKEKEQTERKPK